MTEIALDTMQLAKSFRVDVKLKNLRRFTWRTQLVRPILELAAWIAPFTIVVHEDVWEPWLAYCPICKRESAARKPKNAPAEFVLYCPHCHKSSLAEMDMTGAVVLSSGQERHCDYGCHFKESCGFVVMAGCPVHD